MIPIAVTDADKRAYDGAYRVGASCSITTGNVTFVAHILTWTWREAIEVASRAGAKATVRREGDRWAVRYRYKPVLINGPA